MKYASEVIELMSSHAGRRMKIRQIVRYVNSEATVREREAIRVGVHRVLRQLEETGHVFSTRGEVINGACAEYWWGMPVKTVTSSSCEAYQKP